MIWNYYKFENEKNSDGAELDKGDYQTSVVRSSSLLEAKCEHNTHEPPVWLSCIVGNVCVE